MSKDNILYTGHFPIKTKSTSPPNCSSGVGHPNRISPNIMIYEYNNTSYKVQVYDIAYDSCGYPLFLIYFNGQWIRKSAKHFRPL